jgi:hypothetical protein
MTQHFHILSKVTAEPPALPPVEHTGVHILNAPLFDRKYARVYFGDQESRDPVCSKQRHPEESGEDCDSDDYLSQFPRVSRLGSFTLTINIPSSE